MRAKRVALGVCICVVVANVTVASVGPQIGGTEIDLIPVIMTRFYEKTLSSEDIVFERAETSPAGVGALKAALARHSN